MIFSRQNKQTPDVRTKLGKVLAIENGLLDIVTTGGSAVFRRVRCSGPLPNEGDKVMVSFYKNNEIVATPVSTKESDTVSQLVNVTGGGGITIYQGTGYTIGDGLNLSGGNVLTVRTTPNRTQITGGKVDVDTSLLPSPLIGDAGKSLVANGANSSSWVMQVQGTVGYIPKFTAAGSIGNTYLYEGLPGTLMSSTSGVGMYSTRSGADAYAIFTAETSNDKDGDLTLSAVSFARRTVSVNLRTLDNVIQLMGNVKFAVDDSYSIGAVGAGRPQNILSSGYMWATKTLNAGAGANRDAAYSLDIKETDLALAAPTGSIATTGGWILDEGYTYKFRVWAFKNVAGRRIYSPTYLELTYTDPGSGTFSYYLALTINAVTGADGYKVRVIDDSYQGIGNSNDYCWEDVATGTLTYNDSMELDGNSVGYDPSNIVTPAAAFTDLIIGGRSIQTKMPVSFSGLTSGETYLWATDVAGNNVVYLPTGNGTIALTSQIPVASGTTNSLVKFTSSSTIGDSNITENGSSINLNRLTNVNGATDNTQFSVSNFGIASGSITPSAIPGLQIWLKADAITGKVDGNSVESWVDSSGNGRAFIQYTASKMPTYKTNIVNSKPVVRHTAASLQTLWNDYAPGEACTIFAVTAISGAATKKRVISGARNNWLLGYWNGNEDSAFYNGWVNNSVVAATTNWKIYTARIGNSNSDFRSAGSLVASNNGGLSGPVGLTTNDGLNQTEYSDCDVAELIVYDRVLTTDQVKGVEKYLADKYAITIAHTGGKNEQTVSTVLAHKDSFSGVLSSINNDGSHSAGAYIVTGPRGDYMKIKQERWNWTTFRGQGAGGMVFDWGYAAHKFKMEHVGVAPTLADSGVAGNPNGTYSYMVAFQTGIGNTGRAAASSSITVTSKQITLTNIPLGTPGIVTARHIYRTAAGGATYKFLVTLNDNTTTTYTDNIADGSLGGTIGHWNFTGGAFDVISQRQPSVGNTPMRLHPQGVWVDSLAIGSGTIHGGYLTWPYNQNIQSMNSTGDGLINVLGAGPSGITFGAGFFMGNQGITGLYSLSFYATGRLSTASGGGNYDLEINNNAGGTGKLKWFGGSSTYHMNILDNAGGGYAGFGSNLTPTSRVHVDGSFARTGTAKSANFNCDANASCYYVTTGSSADITATLPVASTCNGREYIFVKVDSGTKDIIITRASTDTINGATTLNVGTAQYSTKTIKSDGANWYVI